MNTHRMNANPRPVSRERGTSDQSHWTPSLQREGLAWNLCVTDLMEVGLSLAEAALWSRARHSEALRDLPRIVRGYLDVGFTATEGYWWWHRYFWALEATAWASAGWSARTAGDLHWALLHQSNPLESPPHEWLDSGVPGHRCVLYALAGCSLQEAVELEARHRNGEEVDPGLRTLAGLRGMSQASRWNCP